MNDTPLLLAMVVMLLCIAYRYAHRGGSPGASVSFPASKPPVTAISFDGLVQHYVVTGVLRPRKEDQLPYNRPLAPRSPPPKPVPLRVLLAKLPRFAVHPVR